MIKDLIHLLLLLNIMLICTQAPSPGARVVYIDGAFDLFHAGHVEVLFLFVPMQIFKSFCNNFVH